MGGNADMPFDFFLSRYNEAYVTETIAFCDSLVNDKPVPCTGVDGLVALTMAIAADKSVGQIFRNYSRRVLHLADGMFVSQSGCHFPRRVPPLDESRRITVARY